LAFNVLATGVTSSTCAILTANNAQLLLTVDKNTALGSSALKSVIYNTITQSTSGTILSSFLYKENIIEFSSLTNNLVSMNFDLLPIHKKILVRARVMTSCTVAQNQTLKMTLSGASPVIVSKPLTVGQ
jgi:hypothetical protein